MSDSNKVCPICQEEEKTGRAHQAHYGVICCKSCKAFFRRIVQLGIDSSKLKCKSQQEHCDLKVRVKCKKCRYLQCLRIGLDPSNVLGVEERKKFTYPRKNKGKNEANSPENESNSPESESNFPETEREIKTEVETELLIDQNSNLSANDSGIDLTDSPLQLNSSGKCSEEAHRLPYYL